MPIYTYLILIGILLIIIDLFFHSDLPTYIALVLFSTAFFMLVENFNVILRLIFSVLFFLVLIVIHHYVWKTTVLLLVDKLFAKDRYKAGIEGLVGNTGIVRIIDGKKLASIHGDLYQFYKEVELMEGEQFEVKNVRDGKILIE